MRSVVSDWVSQQVLLYMLLLPFLDVLVCVFLLSHHWDLRNLDSTVLMIGFCECIPLRLRLSTLSIQKVVASHLGAFRLMNKNMQSVSTQHLKDHLSNCEVCRPMNFSYFHCLLCEILYVFDIMLLKCALYIEECCGSYAVMFCK